MCSWDEQGVVLRGYPGLQEQGRRNGGQNWFLQNPFLVADKTRYSKAQESLAPLPWNIWICEKSYEYPKFILQIQADQQYGENLRTQVFPKVCLQLFLRKVFNEHWGERDFGYLGGGSSWLLTFCSQSVWGWKVSKTVLKFSMVFGRLMMWVWHAESKRALLNWICILSLCLVTSPDCLSGSWSLLRCAGVIFSWSHSPHEACYLYPSTDWWPRDRRVCCHCHWPMSLGGSKNIPCHTYCSWEP